MQHYTIPHHDYTALDTVPPAELTARRQQVRHHLQSVAPQASGLLVFSRVNIYYLTGTLADGLLWLPLHGDPLLLARKGLERASLESPGLALARFRSYKELPTLALDAGTPLGDVVAVEKRALNWEMADMLMQRVPTIRFVPGDEALHQARMIKSPWELERLRQTGRCHARAVQELLPQRIHPGMTEAEIARQCIGLFLELGHGGVQRMNAHGEEVFFGHLAANDSGNYPHYYNGPMGYRGAHPASPCLGSDTIWAPGTPLTVDMAFTLHGYVTDKTQTYWAGSRQTLPSQVAEAYALCVDVQNLARDLLRPGVAPSHIWEQTRRLMENSPFDQGFMGLAGNKVPFLGHGIGLCIDERPVIARGFDQPLCPGMVLAVEPKIGIPGFGMVGIENTFEITTDAPVNLTAFHDDMIFVE